MTTTTDHALDDIHAERDRQDQKWGEQNRCPTAFIAICAEELGEATKHALTLDLHNALTPEDKITELIKYRIEMVQLAACACAAIEAIDRNLWTAGELRSKNERKPEN